MRTEFYYPSCSAGTIHACRWEPEGQPIAVIQIVHGLGGHSLRYDHFATHLAENGFLVVAQDHMGHGQSVSESGVRGCFTGGWFKAVADVRRLLRTTRMENPDIPYILLGQSMGAFLVQTLLEQYPKCDVSAAVLCGTGWIHRGLLNSGIATAMLLSRVNGAHTPSPRLKEMLFGGFNRRVEHKRTDYDWLSRSSKAVDAYVEDPLCCHSLNPTMAKDLLTGMKFNQESENVAKIRKNLPLLVISGGDDPVGNYGEGVKKLVQAFTRAEMEDVTMRIYPLCRHELINELNREEVYRHIMEWIHKQID